ncbi:MAG: PBP1A family penicillin-binding protein [Actinobacteria bacterium]|nr:PBP1A family penicillin-binding protein [Actinomycetota bacterium]
MKVISRILFTVVLGITVLTGGTILWFYLGIGLPSLASLEEYKAAQNSKIYAADGTLLATLHGDQNRELMALSKIPDHMQNAVIAIEDIDFYEHSGVNWKAVVRALWTNVVKGSVVQGGSTITQQYVKNAYVGTKRTLWRKIQEARLAYELDRKYSKRKIMEMYLNDIYLGQSCYGIYTASYKYFGKNPQELTLPECAMLAGIIRSPSYYDPFVKPEEVQQRRNLVLKVMEQQKFITKAEMEAASAEPMNITPKDQPIVERRYPYFCDYIIEKMKREYGDQMVFRGGLRIYTALDPRMQDLAESTVKNMTNPEKGPDAALVCLDPRTGYIKAMVGGKNYKVSQFNVAADGHRQAGSSFKVFVLIQALSDGVSPDKTYSSSSPMIIDLPDGQKWKVSNYGGGGGGHMTIESATIRSVNVVYAQMIMDLGPSRVASTAKKMGIMTEIDSNPAIALGGLTIGVTPLEMASAYGTLANNGKHAVPHSVIKITDADGKVIEENKPEVEPSISSEIAFEANKILQKVVSSGTGTGAQIGRPQAGKTGTTEDNADAWFVGYTPDLVTAVWVGYPQGRVSMGSMTGGSMPASIWRSFMSKALEDVPATAFLEPGEELPEEQVADQDESETVTLVICNDSGLIATSYCPHTHSQTFERGAAPTQNCNIHTARQSASVPNVVGMSSSGASSTLSSAGYSVTTVSQASSRPAGTVVSQVPAPGTALSRGGTVTIMVSTGEVKNTVPSVVGLSESAAIAKLSGAGFVASVNYVNGSPPGIVSGQRPSSGTQLSPGSSVSITVNKSGTGSGIWGYVFSLFK